jgi:hypothetical protein
VTFYPAAQLLPNTTYTVVVTTSIRDIRGRAVPSPQTARCTTVTAGPTLAAGQVTISFPDRTTGRVRVTATQGTAEPEHLVLLLNTSSGSTTSTTVNADGSSTGELFALLGDELLAVIQNDEGNQTVLPIGTYRDVDGTTVVTRLGGEVTGGGDARLTLPPGSVIGPTPVKVTLKAPGALPVSLPPAFQPLGGLDIEAQGAVLTGDIKASIPLPAGFTPPPGAAAQGFLAQLVTLNGQPETVIVDAARVVGERLINGSPPFPGLQHLVVLHTTPAGATFQPFGANSFWYFVNPLPYPALVLGTVTRPMGAPVGPGTIRLEEPGPAGRPVEADYFLEDRGATVVVRPRQHLKFATPYQVSIEGTLEDQDGQPLGRRLTTGFTTAAPAAAGVAIRNAKDVALLGEVAFVLDRERGLAVVNGGPAGVHVLDLTNLLHQPIGQVNLGFDDGPPPFTGSSLDGVTHTYTAQRLYFPTATVTDASGGQTRASTVVNVFPLPDLVGKRNTIKAALRRGDLEGALALISVGRRATYRALLTALGPRLAQIDQMLTDLRFVDQHEGRAEFQMLRVEDGILLSYFVLFAVDQDRIWRLTFF